MYKYLHTVKGMTEFPSVSWSSNTNTRKPNIVHRELKVQLTGRKSSEQWIVRIKSQQNYGMDKFQSIWPRQATTNMTNIPEVAKCSSTNVGNVLLHQ